MEYFYGIKAFVSKFSKKDRFWPKMFAIAEVLEACAYLERLAKAL
jgi:hypothetical protein